MRQARKEGLSVLGMGAAACVACCASPILAIIGGLGLAGLASTLLVGVTGLVIAVAAMAALLVVGRRRKDCLVSDDSPAPVAAPTRRTADLSRSAQ
jgi:hypothetical protein